ncbi:Flp family type IVb pilin [Consotaella salsifontis]|uniref:Pilus assembly protein Flp/PilA n=1 Tax=Consotaella salsifontis TaxID=1365950 RepID=A0A1T4TB91_9HYPH|nr:Flp family type IVb pilin [Consotaella salsifontis]SKA37673.1 pilus assembly protein Flp/PilA [Consotaella salsifontis]
MAQFLRRFSNDESGATAIEYGLIAAIMSVALITALGYITGGLDTAFTNIKTTLEKTS